MDDQRPLIVWLNAVLIALTFAAICSRAGRRIFVVRKFGWHDGLITFAGVAATAFSVFQLVGTGLGLGLHQSDSRFDKTNGSAISKLILASNVFYFLCNWAVKHALLLFYSEIAREKKYLYSIYFMHFIAFSFGLSSILVNIFQCRPFNKVWRDDLPGYCVNMPVFFYFNSSIMLITDIVLYAMPVVFTWHLQLQRQQRIGLNFLFGLGCFVLAASAARVQAVHKINTVENDFLWWFSKSMIWSVLENHLAVVVACAPSVKVIALLLFPRLASSLGKVVSKVTPSNSRSRSRASGPFDTDLESGTGKSDKLRPTPSGTPLPSPAFSQGSGSTRASRNFSKWFKGPASPRLQSGDSEEGHGLVYVEDRQHSKHVPLEDIRVERTLSIESAKEEV
ncbi:hypothetical protein BDV95DRAFT_606136 [Massariosphaeria phaeospora]|uniref:Rhodopsin domain-containing protein n=1 Tax=Massariosphaeria phaeospora TaxID=100035 RepID=A0A7C8I7C9_9PLEO|nr:hypothetical protein BDV95DRAFT_606136 [Massariosphaeria phaeospora]